MAQDDQEEEEEEDEKGTMQLKLDFCGTETEFAEKNWSDE